MSELDPGCDAARTGSQSSVAYGCCGRVLRGWQGHWGGLYLAELVWTNWDVHNLKAETPADRAETVVKKGDEGAK